MEIRVHYLYNSGFAVTFGTRLLVFDYFLDTPKNGGIADGVIRGDFLKNREVSVFATHVHGDHYSPLIFNWRKQNERIQYILSSDIGTKESSVSVSPGETIEAGGLTVRALKSTDEGAALLIQADGLCIYHAGDLNWWHWNGETPSYNAQMAMDYQEQINLLEGKTIDFAFVPVDPRLEDKALLGIDYFMRKTNTKHVFPMHFGNDFTALRALECDPRTEGYRSKITVLKERGESAQFEMQAYPVQSFSEPTIKEN